jgi:hypothetical protein
MQLLVLKQFWKGLDRNNGPPPPNEYQIISPPMLLLMAPHSPPGHIGRLFNAASSILSLRGRRGGELWPEDHALRILWKHWVLKPGGAILLVVTKTKPLELFYPELDSPICPIARMRALRISSPFACRDEDPIFRLENDIHLSRAVMISLSNAVLKAARINTGVRLSSKSWRAGLVVHSVALGHPSTETKSLGAWESDAYLAYNVSPSRSVSKSVESLVSPTARIRKPSLKRRKLT